MKLRRSDQYDSRQDLKSFLFPAPIMATESRRRCCHMAAAATATPSLATRRSDSSGARASVGASAWSRWKRASAGSAGAPAHVDLTASYITWTRDNHSTYT